MSSRRVLAWVRANFVRGLVLVLCLTALYLRPVPTGFTLAFFLSVILFMEHTANPPTKSGPDGPHPPPSEGA